MMFPLDRSDYPPDHRRQQLLPGLPDGRYVYAQDLQGTIWVVPDDQPHLHPKILGHGFPAGYAGDVTVKQGTIVEITNCSGTFQFDEAEGLLRVIASLRQEGWKITAGGVKLFSHTVSARPIILE